MYLKNNIKITTNIFYPPMIIFTLRLDGQIITRMKCVRKKDKILLLGDIEPFSKEEYINKGYG